MGTSSGTLEHTADLGLWVEADSLAELFQGAALALGRLMAIGPPEGQITWREVDLNSVDLAGLLVEFLGELVYLAETGQGVLARAEIEQVAAGRLRARLGLVGFDPVRHQAGEPVKAVTYHKAKVAEEGGRWRAEVYLDV